MAAPTPDPGIAELVGHWPCMTRRWLGKTGNAAIFLNYELFPWLGQNITTPAGRTPPWTTDDTTRPIP